jgi:hypothetical protein
MNKLKRKAHQPLWWMPNLDTEGAIGFYSTELGLDRQKAANLVRRHQNLYWANPKRNRSPIVFDEEMQLWHGRKARTIRESAGLRRTGDDPNSHRNRLRDVLGTLSYFRSSLIETIKVGLAVDDDEAESIFKQGRARRFLLCDNDRPEATKTWRFLGAPLPDPALFPAENSGSRRAYYLRLYQDMKRLKHRPGDYYDPEESEVLKFILEKNGRDFTPGNFEWAESEYHRLCRYGTSPDDKNAVIIFDRDTFETLGIQTFRSEMSPEAKAAKIEAGRVELKKEKAAQAAVAKTEAEKKIEDERLRAERIAELAKGCRLMPKILVGETGAINEHISWISTNISDQDQMAIFTAAKTDNHITSNREVYFGRKRDSYTGADWKPAKAA